MEETFTLILRAQRKQICARWEALLRIEKVHTPLANPDTLVFLFNQTLDDVFAALEHTASRRAEPPVESANGKNPLLAYFRAGEQALLESLVLAQAREKNLDPAVRGADVAQLKAVMHRIARRDIGALEGILQSSKQVATQAAS